MMELLAAIIHALLDAWEMHPSELTDITLFQSVDPGCWYAHVEPDRGYFACITWLKNYGYAVSTHDYIVLEVTP